MEQFDFIARLTELVELNLEMALDDPESLEDAKAGRLSLMDAMEGALQDMEDCWEQNINEVE